MIVDVSLQKLLIGNQKCDAADDDGDTDGVMIPLCLSYCKFGNFREGFIFAKLRIYAKFRENKILAKWPNYSVDY